MTCVDCEKRRRQLRDAIMAGKVAEALGYAVVGVREMVGIGPHGSTEPLPALTDKTKAELVGIAEAEGTTIDPEATKAAIITAIEAHRATV